MTLDRYTIQKNSPIQPVLFRHGPATLGDPCRTFAFLRTNSMIGTSPRNTIERVLDWCRTNLIHFSGRYEPANLQSQWQYSGWPPVETVLSGTPHPRLGIVHITAGCWGTTGFLRALLRTANIPVTLEVLQGCGHAFTRFAHEGLYLSHGDDPYSPLIMATPAVPIDELLINQATFNSWFGSHLSAQTRCNNTARRTFELAFQYLPNILLRMHCVDKINNKTPAQSDVYIQTGFSLVYSVAQLQALGLWTRMDAKIASFGGCNNIPKTNSAFDRLLP